MTSTIRRRLLAGIAALTAGATFALSLAGTAFAQQRETVRIGYQKYGTLIILKARGTLEKRLAPLGVDVKWTEFPSGPPMLEALNVGSLDFGTVGEAPPIFAQAAGANLVYVGNEPPSPTAEAIVVPKDSPLKSLQELRGKKIALNKGSNVHYLLVRALQSAGIPYGDIQTVYLAPADARAAFERHAVDAWVIWDPFLAAAEKQLGARVLVDGKGLVDNTQFYLASRPYAEKNPRVVQAVLEELNKIDEWGKKNPNEVASFLAPEIGLELPVVQLASQRYSFGVLPVSDPVIAGQQKIADAFYDLKLIPKKITVKDATLAQPIVPVSPVAAR